MVIKVALDGTVTVVVTVIGHADKDRAILAALGQVETVRRGGHAVPSQRPLRVAFRLIRRVFGRFPRVVGWTRTWPVAWMADLGVSGGPVLGPFWDRTVAIAAEERWLADRG
jgi:hypothetical protein